MKVLFFTVIITCLLTSCSNYYRAALASSPITAGTIEDLKTNNKYFILRDGNQAYSITNISFNSSQKIMQCTLETLPQFEHRLYLTNGAKGNMKYNKEVDAGKTSFSVLDEVHLYTNHDGNIAAGPYSLSLDQVQKIEILEKDVAKTKASHRVGAIIGITSAVLLLGGIVAGVVASQSIF